jgi:hypothetical protein
MKKIYAIDLVNSLFSKEEATELILGLIDYKIDVHSRKNFSNQVKFGEEDEDSKYRLEKLTAAREAIKEMITTSKESHFKLCAELTIEPKGRLN